MKMLGVSFFLFIISLNNAFCVTPVENTDIKVSNEIAIAMNDINPEASPMLMKGNPNSAWNRWGKKALAFTGVFVAGVGAGIGLGSVVPGIGTTSGAIVGVVGGLLAGVAVVRNMHSDE